MESRIRERDLVQACRDAEILDVVQALPDGFETKLSEGGQNLSGGQRQRLELAGRWWEPQHPDNG